MSQILKWPVLLAALCVFAINGYAQSESSEVKEKDGKRKTKVKKEAPAPKVAAAPRPKPAPRVKKPKVIDRELSFGYRFMTNGWALFAEKGYVTSIDKNSDKFYNLRLFQVELGEMKDPNQIKRTNNTFSSGNSDGQQNPLIYGKINNFYTLKLGYGGRRMIAGKPEPGTISIHWVYIGGISLGMAKPYYVDAFVGGTEKQIKYEDDKEAFLNKNNIVGGSGLMKGIGELTFNPGGHIKTGLHFDFAASKKSVVAIETGFDAQYYSQEIKMMANQPGTSYFVNFYASFQVGYRK